MHLLLISVIACLHSISAKHIVHFHHNVPSYLHVNAAQGPVTVEKASREGEADIINLLLYPSDKKSRAPKTASVIFSGGNATGKLRLRQDSPPTGPTFISGSVEGLMPGLHEINVYTLGDLSEGCSSIGNVYGPHKISLSRRSRYRHTGYLGTIMADKNGKAEVAMSNPYVTLVGPRSILGRAIGIISGVQNGVGESTKDGCGVVGYAK